MLLARGLIHQPPVQLGAMGRLLSLLGDIGWADLAVARIYEGHVNALWLISQFGTPGQAETAEKRALNGGVFGVWNTDDPQDPVVLEDGCLKGRKIYASGADGVDTALVTASTPAGRVLVSAPINGLPVDRDWWGVQGMRLSGSHIVDFTSLEVSESQIIGVPDDYIAQPWFSGGAIRFAAVHVGGMHAVHDALLDHLSRSRRSDDPFQQHRLARSAMLVETGYLWLQRATSAWTQAEEHLSPEAGVRLEAVANATRMAVELAALEVLELAERGVGAMGFMESHPLERLARDLRTYLRQPAPDRALSLVGQAVADGVWAPGDLGNRGGICDPDHP